MVYAWPMNRHRTAGQGDRGVHRQHFHTSTDLPEPARTPLVAVCARTKAIADLLRTLAWLKTYRVPVLEYSSDLFPAFYSQDSGPPVGAQVDTPEEAAHIVHIKKE